VVQACFFGELARGDGGIAIADKQAFGSVEKSLFGFLACRCDPDSLTLCRFNRSALPQLSQAW